MLSPKSKSSMSVSELNTFFKETPHLSDEDVEDFEDILKENRLLKGDGGVNKWE